MLSLIYFLHLGGGVYVDMPQSDTRMWTSGEKSELEIEMQDLAAYGRIYSQPALP